MSAWEAWGLDAIKAIFLEGTAWWRARWSGQKAVAGGQRHAPHRARALHRARHPVHVTLRAALRSLRDRHVVRTVLGALRDSHRESFRIAHYSVQHNHLHLIVEAEDKSALSRGMHGLMVRVARRVNRLLFRRGRFWADRWHGHTLTAPREVRNTLRYVLHNHRKHSSASTPLDPLSSAQWFNGFATPLPPAFRSIGPPCIAVPRTWLLRVGWQRHGKISNFRTAAGRKRRKPLTARRELGVAHKPRMRQCGRRRYGGPHTREPTRTTAVAYTDLQRCGLDAGVHVEVGQTDAFRAHREAFPVQRAPCRRNC